MNERLTIAIPTFDRNATLAERLPLLLPQLTKDCRLLILDNHSPVPVSDTLESVLGQIPQDLISIVRWPVNIGMSANIVRCFELCDTPWLWVLGDDDYVRPNAIEIIMEELDRCSDCMLINFNVDSPPWRWHDSEIRTVGQKEFISKVSNFVGVTFISTNIYKASALKAYLGVGYRYAYSFLPQLAMLLANLGDTGRCLFSARNIVDEGTSIAEKRWTIIPIVLGFGVIPELAEDSASRRELSRKIGAIFWRWLGPRGIVRWLLLESLETGDFDSSVYIYDKICARLAYYNNDLRLALEIAMHRLMLRWPRLTKALYRLHRGRSLVESSKSWIRLGDKSRL